MQTFLPYVNFRKSARVLDRKRLGKQRVEAYQILNVITGKSVGWKNHPAVKMWVGYEEALRWYGDEVCREWIRRGYKDSLLEKFDFKNNCSRLPPWLGNEKFHISHRSNLLRKFPDHYRKFWPKLTSELPYYWPESK